MHPLGPQSLARLKKSRAELKEPCGPVLDCVRLRPPTPRRTFRTSTGTWLQSTHRSWSWSKRARRGTSRRCQSDPCAHPPLALLMSALLPRMLCVAQLKACSAPQRLSANKCPEDPPILKALPCGLHLWLAPAAMLHCCGALAMVVPQVQSMQPAIIASPSFHQGRQPSTSPASTHMALLQLTVTCKPRIPAASCGPGWSPLPAVLRACSD